MSSVLRSAVYRCCTDQNLKISMIMTSYSPVFYFDASTQEFTGYLPLLLEWLSREMGFDYSFDLFVPETYIPGEYNNTRYHAMLT